VAYERLVPLAAGKLFEANIQSAAHRRVGRERAQGRSFRTSTIELTL
jgi:hypothetical protein